MNQRPQNLARAIAKRGHEFHYYDKSNTDQPVEQPLPMQGLFVHHKGWSESSLKGKILLTSWSDYKHLMSIADLTVFDNLDMFPEWEQNDLYMLKHSDVVLCSSQKLLDRAHDIGRYDTILVPNACDFAHWQQKHAIHKALVNIPEPRVLYCGALAAWVDRAMIEHCADNAPEISFVCVGVNWSHMSSYNNLHVVGELPYDQLPSVFAGCKIGIIPFLISNVTKSADCVKMYEYLAAGLSVVHTRLPEVERFTGIKGAKNAEEFLGRIKEILRTRSWFDNTFLTQKAKDNQWSDRAKLICDATYRSIENRVRRHVHAKC